MSSLLVAAGAQALTAGEAASLAKKSIEHSEETRLTDPTTGKRLDDSRPLVDKDVLAAKNAERAQIMESAGTGRYSEAEQTIQRLITASELVNTGGRILRNPQDMDQRGYQRGRLGSEVWSSPGWSRYRGHTAQRYTVPQARDAKNWLDAWNYVSTPGFTYFDLATSPSGAVRDDLSAAEKYDLLISDPRQFQRGILSRNEWRKGAEQQEQFGRVPTWYGYCHGWAPASFMVRRPLKAIDVRTQDGRAIRFYPSDIKALSAALWANGKIRTRQIGKRCNLTDPPRDGVDRPTREECNDVNPGLFHMAVVNQISGASRNVIMDAAFDAEIWNKPIVGYDYYYFNPATGASTRDFRAAAIGVRNFNDRYARYRSRNTGWVAGVVMEVEYSDAARATHEMTDGPRFDKLKKVTYVYDLEIGFDGNIIGGEWHQLKHPDFLWAPPKGSGAVTNWDDDATGNWDGNGPLPATWAAAAREAGSRSQPLSKIVNQLVRMSRQ